MTMRQSRIRLATLAVALLALFGASMLVAESVSAGKGGNKPATSSGTIWTSPDTAPAWGGAYTLNGGGFDPYAGIQIGQSIAGGCCSTFAVRADANGAFTLPGETGEPGDYVFTAYVYTRRGWKAVATTTLHVE
jgi:hypothetical protein